MVDNAFGHVCLCVCLAPALTVKSIDLETPFLAHDAFVRTNRCAIAMMFERRSVCLSGTAVHCDHTVHFSADLSLRLDSPIF